MSEKTVLLQKVGDITVTKRDIEIMEKLADGLRVKEIAVKLKISARTVDTHMNNLRRKTGIITLSGLTAYFFRNKLIQ